MTFLHPRNVKCWNTEMLESSQTATNIRIKVHPKIYFLTILRLQYNVSDLNTTKLSNLLLYFN